VPLLTFLLYFFLALSDGYIDENWSNFYHELELFFVNEESNGKEKPFSQESSPTFSWLHAPHLNVDQKIFHIFLDFSQFLEQCAVFLNPLSYSKDFGVISCCAYEIQSECCCVRDRAHQLVWNNFFSGLRRETGNISFNA